MIWTYTPVDAERLAALSRGGRLQPVLAELLCRAGCLDGDEATRFLQPELAGLGDPFLLENLDRATGRLREALARGERIMVLGDYDVDGVSSTALLVSILRRLGASPGFVVPRRSEDGYGLSRSAIDRALESGRPDLFVALDCGTNSHDEIAYLRAQGIDVIVIDHHRSKDRPLADCVLINPHVHPGRADPGCGDLCTVGLVFKLVHGLLKQLRAENHADALAIRLRDYLDFVALGTVADLVPLRGENRILARHGLQTLQATTRRGLRALMDIAGIRPGQELQPVDISYRLGPRINASGRLADAAISVELLLSDDPQFSSEVAQQLDLFNRERQDIERLITEEAEQNIERNYGDSPGIVLYGESWHPGVVGIVAGRVSRKYNRPCVVLGREGEFAKGSGRGVDGINLVEVLGACGEHLTSWGGHPMAVGVVLNKVNLDRFRERFAAAVRQHAGGGISEARLPISAWLTPEQVDEDLMEHLDSMHPFGQGNPSPVFGLRGVTLQQRPEVFREHHFRFSFTTVRGRRLYGVAWKMAPRPIPTGVPVDLAVELKWNYFNDRKLIQLGLVDWRPSAS